MSSDINFDFWEGTFQAIRDALDRPRSAAILPDGVRFELNAAFHAVKRASHALQALEIKERKEARDE